MVDNQLSGLSEDNGESRVGIYRLLGEFSGFWDVNSDGSSVIWQ